MILKTNTNREFECSSVIEGIDFPALYISTDKITPNEIFSIFTDKNETARLTVLDNDKEKTYTHYTILHSVSQTTMMTGKPEFLIRMNRSFEE